MDFGISTLLAERNSSSFGQCGRTCCMKAAASQDLSAWADNEEMDLQLPCMV